MKETGFSQQRLPGRAVVQVVGETALAFLHNLLTCDLLHLQAGQAAYGALLTPQGKILHDVFIIPDGGRVLLDCAAGQTDALLQKLLMYRLRAKLQISRDESLAVAVSPMPDLQGITYADPRLAAMGYRAIVPAGMLEAGDGYDATRIRLGLADSEADIGSGEIFPHEANFDQLNGVSFTKGCYVGQEVVSRTHHRKAARSRILPVRLEAPAARGTAIESGETKIGDMLSSSGDAGLALLRLDKLAESTSPLMAGMSLLHVTKPAWATFELDVPEAAS